MSAPTSPPVPDTHYRLAPALVWRVLGAQVAAFGLGFLGVIVVVFLADLPLVIAVLTLLVGLLVVSGTAWWLRAAASVMTLTTQGYAVRLLRGVGVREASWTGVSEVATSTPQGVALVVLRLEDDRRTTIPVAALAGNREDFIRDLQRRLQSGHGLQRL